MRCASSTGWRTGTCRTQVPISTRLVTAAATLMSTIGSKVGRPRPNESVIQRPWNPRSSTCRAKLAKRSRVRPAMSGVPRRTLTTCTRILVCPLFGPFEKALGQAREEADAIRQGAVVEVVARVVQEAAALAGAVADPQHRPRPRPQHVGEVLA